MEAGFQNLSVMDFEDFYITFKKILKIYFKIELIDEIHKNKIAFYIDSEAQSAVMPEDLSLFFDLCWSKPSDYALIISNDLLQIPKNLGSESLKIELIKISPKNDNMKLN